jgi:hypothetical protein
MPRIEITTECKTWVSLCAEFGFSLMIFYFILSWRLSKNYFFSVDLVMWRDVSKSAFVFGLGTFMLVSSSHAKDLNFK